MRKKKSKCGVKKKQEIEQKAKDFITEMEKFPLTDFSLQNAIVDFAENYFKPKFNLQFCKTCFQMTNHLGNECQKCKTIIK